MTQVNRPDQIAVEDYRLRALDLRRAGKQFREIAAILGAEGGPKSVSRAHELVIEGLKDLRDSCREASADIRDIEVQRCDAMIAALWPKIGKPGYVDAILKVMNRKSRYLGLDAPKRIEATGAGGAPLLPPGAVTIQLVAPAHVQPSGTPLPAEGEPVNLSTTGEGVRVPPIIADPKLVDVRSIDST